MKTIDTHLGRTADGTLQPAYVTPTEIDSSLLVPIPRSENRVKHAIDPDLFVGFDRWNCYEFSTLTRDGFPLGGLIQIVYRADTEFIVESKSLKLYLNSFNMFRMDAGEAFALTSEVETRTASDLYAAGILTNVKLTLDTVHSVDGVPAFRESFVSLETLLLSKHPKVEARNPFGLDTARYKCSVRSNCKITNQPDWGTVYFAMRPALKTLDPQDLFNTVTSLRTANHFHEEICELLYQDIWNRYEPKQLLVGCNYLRRGGIDINPVRASSEVALQAYAANPLHETIARDRRQ